MKILNSMPSAPQEGELIAYYIPQVGSPPTFYVSVTSPDEAKQIINLLAQYDIFQYENRIKEDYVNIYWRKSYWSGLLVFEHGEWVEWENEDGDDISKISERNSR